MRPKPFYSQLYFRVLVGMVLGIVVGILLPKHDSPLHVLGVDVSGESFKIFSDAFIRLIRMMIAPIIFTTVVVGIARMDNLKRVGRIGLKSFIYFEVMTTLALAIGFVVAKTFQPGAGMNADPARLNIADLQTTLAAAKAPRTAVEFFLNIIPKTIVGAFAEGEILQVLFFSVIFGMAMSGMGEANRPILRALDQISKVLMRMVAMIIEFAPLAVFGAMSFTISKFGIASLQPLVKLMACVYFTCIFFVVICLGLLLRFNGLSIWKVLRYVRDELFIVFGTASSEPAFPRLMAKLEQLGCSKPLVGIVLPSGYSFNLDGSSIYLTMGALFIAQATNAHLSFGQELAVLFVCLLTSKGAAAVVGGGFITLAATLAGMKTIPVEGMILILGIDWFMAQARGMTNMVGNTVATLVIARWENELDRSRAIRVLDGETVEPSEPAIAPATEPVEDPQT